MRQAYIYTPRALQAGIAWAHPLGMAKKPKKPKTPKFPNNIGLWREAQPGMTQEKLGSLINRAQETIGRYESGDINPPASILNAIAKVLKCTTTDLIDGIPGEGDIILRLVRDMKPETRRRVAVVVKAMKEAEG